jgi:hypothetical protein
MKIAGCLAQVCRIQHPLFFLVTDKLLNHAANHVTWSYIDWTRTETLLAESHESAAAQMTVLRTTTLSYGNMRFQVPAKLKALNRSICNFAQLIMLATLCDVPKMVWIAYLGRPHRQMKYSLTNFSYCIPYLTLPFFWHALGLPPKRLNRFARPTAQVTVRFL